MARYLKSNWAERWRQRKIGGAKERLAEACGFTVTFDGIILNPKGEPAKLNYNQFTGYYNFSVNGSTIVAHRFIWHFLNRPIKPGMVIDHINGNRGDNHPDNLREVTKSQNGRNRLQGGKTWQDKEVGL